MRSTGYAVPFISRWLAVIGAFRSSLFWREVIPSVVRCCTVFLLCFLIVGIHASGISAIPVDVMRVKSYVNSFLDPSGVPVRVSVNKLYLVPKRVVAGLVGVLRNGGGLGAGESYIPVVFFDSLMHRSSCFPDIDFSAFTRNPADHAILFSRVDGVFRSHQM